MEKSKRIIIEDSDGNIFMPKRGKIEEVISKLPDEIEPKVVGDCMIYKVNTQYKDYLPAISF